MAIVHFSRFWWDLESDIILAFNANNRQKKNADASWFRCELTLPSTHHQQMLNEKQKQKLVDE